MIPAGPSHSWQSKSTIVAPIPLPPPIPPPGGPLRYRRHPVEPLTQLKRVKGDFPLVKTLKTKGKKRTQQTKRRKEGGVRLASRRDSTSKKKKKKRRKRDLAGKAQKTPKGSPGDPKAGLALHLHMLFRVPKLGVALHHHI